MNYINRWNPEQANHQSKPIWFSKLSWRNLELPFWFIWSLTATFRWEISTQWITVFFHFYMLQYTHVGSSLICHHLKVTTRWPPRSMVFILGSWFLLWNLWLAYLATFLKHCILPSCIGYILPTRGYMLCYLAGVITLPILCSLSQSRQWQFFQPLNCYMNMIVQMKKIDN